MKEKSHQTRLSFQATSEGMRLSAGICKDNGRGLRFSWVACYVTMTKESRLTLKILLSNDLKALSWRIRKHLISASM